MAQDVLDTAQAGPLALRGGVLRIASYAGGMMVALITVPLVARHLHTSGYGQYTLAIAIGTIAAGLTEGGVNVVALREYAAHAGRDREIALANMLGIRLLLSAAGLAGSCGFAALAGYEPKVVLATALATVGLMLQVTQGVFSIPLQGELRLGWVAAADLLRQCVAALLVVVLVVAGAQLNLLVATLIPANLAAMALTVGLVRRLVPLRIRFDLRVALPLLRDTLPFAVAIALSATYFRLTVVIVSIIASGHELGIFSYSYRVVEVLIGLPALAIGPVFPVLVRAARDDPARFAYAVDRMLELAVIVAVWMAVCVELGSGFAMLVIGGHAAAPATTVLQIQGLAVVGTFLALALGFPLLALGRYRALMVANGCGLVVTVGLSLALVPSLGARGAALATVGAELALVLVNLRPLLRARPGLKLPLRAVPPAVCAGGAALAIGELIGVQAILDLCVATAVYGAVLALLGRFPVEVGQVLRRRTIGP